LRQVWPKNSGERGLVHLARKPLENGRWWDRAKAHSHGPSIGTFVGWVGETTTQRRVPRPSAPGEGPQDRGRCRTRHDGRSRSHKIADLARPAARPKLRVPASARVGIRRGTSRRGRAMPEEAESVASGTWSLRRQGSTERTGQAFRARTGNESAGPVQKSAAPARGADSSHAPISRLTSVGFFKWRQRKPQAAAISFQQKRHVVSRPSGLTACRIVDNHCPATGAKDWVVHRRPRFAEGAPCRISAAPSPSSAITRRFWGPSPAARPSAQRNHTPHGSEPCTNWFGRSSMA